MKINKRLSKIFTFLTVAFVICMTCFNNINLSAFADDTETYDISVTYYQTNARSMLDYVNDFRTGDDAWYWNSDDTTKTTCSNLSELTYDYALEEVAMQRAAEIAVSFSHTRPNGESCFYAYSDFSYSYSAAGENIAAGYMTVASAFAGWEEANATYSGQGHRRNMLSSNYNRIGIACVRYNGYYYWVMELSYSSVSISETTANDSTQDVSIDVAESMIEDTSLSSDISSYTLLTGDTASVPTVTKKIELVDAWPSGIGISVSTQGTWSSANESCVTISGSNLKAEAGGTTNISATIYDETFSVTVNVYDEPTYSWSSDGSSCDAVFACGSASETVACTVTSETTAAATCTADGSVTYTATCTFLDTDFTSSKTVAVPATGHTYVTTVVEPTTSSKGYTDYTCSECGYSYQSDYTDALPVECDDSDSNENSTKDTTTNSNGNSSRDIITDNSTESSDTVVNGSTYSVGNCKYKVTNVASDGTGTVTLKKVVTKSSTVKIPAKITIGGTSYKVTAIANNAFKNNKKITKLVIGNNVTKIGANAFAGCSKLKTVTIGKNVSKIGKKAFYGCKKLSKITIKSKKLTASKVGSKAFAKIKVNAKIKVPKAKKTTYKKMLYKKGVSKTCSFL